MKAPQFGPRVDAFLSALGERRALLARLQVWGNFPKVMRAHYLAQRGRCAYCGRMLETSVPANFHRPKVTWDHVWPRSSTAGRGRLRNKVLAHSACNTTKADRRPWACEKLFCEITYSIIEDLTRC